MRGVWGGISVGRDAGVYGTRPQHPLLICTARGLFIQTVEQGEKLKMHSSV